MKKKKKKSLSRAELEKRHMMEIIQIEKHYLELIELSARRNVELFNQVLDLKRVKR